MFPAIPPALKRTALHLLRTPLDLGWLFGWRDLLLVLGLAAITYGSRLIYRPLGWIVGGLFALSVYYLMIDGANKAARAAAVVAEQARQEKERKRVQRGTIT